MQMSRTWCEMLCWLTGAIVLLSGCATHTASKAPTEERLYRSKDYIIYKAGPGDTSTVLAARFLGDAKLSWMIDDARDLRPRNAPGHVVIPRRIRNKGGIHSNGVQQVPILCYHRFGNHSASPLVIPEEVFESQMRYLKENGYTTITPEQLLAFLDYRSPLPRKAVMITVDDGYSSFYNVAYPILKKYGFTATLFIYTNFVGVSSKALSWKQLRELKADGFTIGSHTIAHSDLSKKDDDESEKEYMKRLQKEIADSKKIIDAKLDQDTLFFAYPFGRVNHSAMLVTSRCGYKLAVTVNRGGNPFYANRFALQRDQILKRNMSTFVKRLKIFQPLSLR